MSLRTICLVNWRTTLAGVFTIAGAVAEAGLQLLHGELDPGRLGADFVAVVTGLGLISAKDAEVKIK